MGPLIGPAIFMRLHRAANRYPDCTTYARSDGRGGEGGKEGKGGRGGVHTHQIPRYRYGLQRIVVRDNSDSCLSGLATFMRRERERPNQACTCACHVISRADYDWRAYSI